jgi:hypothetical protein
LDTRIYLLAHLFPSVYNAQVIQKRISDSSSEMDKKEWDNVGRFLRRIYATGDDLKGIGAGIYDSAKKKQADAAIAEIRKLAKSADPSVNARDGKGVVAILDKVNSEIDTFLDLLKDIPDEI